MAAKQLLPLVTLFIEALISGKGDLGPPPVIPPPTVEEDADVDVVPDMTMEAVVGGGGGSIIAPTAEFPMKAEEGVPLRDVLLRPKLGVAVVVEIWSGDEANIGAGAAERGCTGDKGRA